MYVYIVYIKWFNDDVDEFLYYSSELYFCKKRNIIHNYNNKIWKSKENIKGNIILELILFLFNTYILLDMMRLA